MLTNKERDMLEVHEQEELENHHRKMDEAISCGDYTPQPDLWCDRCAEETAPTVGLVAPESDPECSVCGWDYPEDHEVRCAQLEETSIRLHKLLRAKNKQIGDLTRENTALKKIDGEFTLAGDNQ